MTDYVLYHHGVKGMKWGVRRYQNKDGSLTAAGRKQRYITTSEGNRNARLARKEALSNAKGKGLSVRQASKEVKKAHKESLAKDKQYNRDLRAERKAEKNTPEAKAARNAKIKKAAKVGAVVAGTALAAYGAYKLHNYVRSENYKIAVEKGQRAAEIRFERLSQQNQSLKKQAKYHQNIADEYRNMSRNAKRGANSWTKELRDATLSSDDRAYVTKMVDSRRKDAKTYTNIAKEHGQKAGSYGKQARAADLAAAVDASLLRNQVTNMENNVNFRTAAKNVYNAKKRKK